MTKGWSADGALAQDRLAGSKRCVRKFLSTETPQKISSRQTISFLTCALHWIYIAMRWGADWRRHERRQEVRGSIRDHIDQHQPPEYADGRCGGVCLRGKR